MTAASTESQQISKLRGGAQRLVKMPLQQRQELLQACIGGIKKTWQRWTADAWNAKRIPAGDGARAEDILTGPIATLRYLHLLHQTLTDIDRHGRPRLPGTPREVRGRWQVPVFPTHNLYDRLLFGPLSAHVRMQAGASFDNLFGDNLLRVQGAAGEPSCITLVLGAGNVSSIPITDALTKIFQDNQAVLLKMNPVNEYVGPICEQAFASLIDADLLRIVYGGADVGSRLIHSDEIDCVHITGSNRTHDAIVWGGSQEERTRRQLANTPRLLKPITSELGNVSPWIVIPGRYTHKELQFQAENIAASITNNASFNCIATKMLVTCEDWPQRQHFLDLLDGILATLPRRFAYYPDAAERYARFAGIAAESEQLPWTLRRNVNAHDEPHLFQEESFVCVCGETTLSAGSAAEFLASAVDLANERMWGTLSAAITVPREFAKQQASILDHAIDQLRYGIVGVNQWPGVAFALMSTPWGAYPGSKLNNIQSGLGCVHNTFLLDAAEKTVLSSPLTIFPKPIWFSTHRCPESVARSLLNMYLRPSIAGIPAVLLHAMRG